MRDFSRIGDLIRRAALPVVTVAAFLAVVSGAWLIHPAAGLITGGVMVLADVIVMHRRPRGDRDDS